MLILVLSAMVGPLSIDLFTPSLPAITEAFGSSAAVTQWTVSIFMIGFSVSMLICGPLSDRFGRRKTLLVGYLVYLIATGVILWTSSIEVFIAARFLQAVAGCFGTALSRAIARDLYKDKNDVKILGMISATLCIAPMVAPIIGGVLQELFGWHSNFVAMIVFGAFVAGAVSLLPESNTPDTETSLAGMLAGYRDLFSDRRFMTLTLTAALAFSGAFVFVASAPFVLIGHFELAPKTYGMLFAIIMGAYIGSSLLAGRITDWLGKAKSQRLAWCILITGTLVAVVSALITDGQSIIGYVAGVAIYEAGLGLFMPACQANALSHLKKHVGTASGLIFFLEMLVASLVSTLAGKIDHSSTLPLAMLTATTLGVAIILTIAFKLFATPHQPTVQA